MVRAWAFPPTFPRRCLGMRLWLAAAMGASILVACLWSAPPTVTLFGRVLLTVCAGAEPRNPPPGYSLCDTHAVAKATVVVAPVHGEVTNAESDASGDYSVSLVPGRYMVAATAGGPIAFFSTPWWLEVSPGRSMQIDIHAQLNMA